MSGADHPETESKTIEGGDEGDVLPEEVLAMIFRWLPAEDLWCGRYALVSRQWRRVMASRSVETLKAETRWTAYANGWAKPRKISGHGTMVGSLAIAQDGTVYLVCSENRKQVEVWSSADLTKLRVLAVHDNSVNDLATGPNNLVYTGSSDHTIKVWCNTDGKHIGTCEGHTAAVDVVAVSSDNMLYSGSKDGSIRIWSGINGEYLRTFDAHAGPVKCITFSPFGEVLSGSNGLLVVWSGADASLITGIQGNTEFTDIASFKDTVAAYVLDDFSLRVWTQRTRQFVRLGDPYIFGFATHSVVRGEDGRLYSADGNNIRIWDVSQEKVNQVLRVPCPGVNNLVLGPNGTIYSSSNDDGIFIW
eukprot:m.471685 g.471685  ORF g.471685 m.471685 type:complete len:361 (+) comp31454_c0_seq1:45-1127(+)